MNRANAQSNTQANSGRNTACVNTTKLHHFEVRPQRAMIWEILVNCGDSLYLTLCFSRFLFRPLSSPASAPLAVIWSGCVKQVGFSFATCGGGQKAPFGIKHGWEICHKWRLYAMYRKNNIEQNGGFPLPCLTSG